jgi:hypothetical protein
LPNWKEFSKNILRILQVYKTSAAPSDIIRSQDVSKVVDAETHSLYKSGVGMLLYLVKFSKPENSNAV